MPPKQQKKGQPVVDAAAALERLKTSYREEFTKRWDTIQKSEETGLEGFEQIAILGRGSFGEVKLVKESSTGNYYACKAMLKDKVIEAKQVQHVYNEKNIMYSVTFPLMVTLQFSRKDNSFIYLGMPFINGGELFQYLRKKQTFSEEQAQFYCAQIFLGLEYLHSVDVVYRDLKPENVLIDSRGYLKMTDFGFAKVVKERTMTLCGTPEYLAPEIIQSKPYGICVDWWAFGVFIHEMVAGYTPFEEYNKNMMDMYTKVCHAEYKMPKFFSPQLKDLIDQFLQVDYDRRMGLLLGGTGDIRKHPWFHSIDWVKMTNQQVQPPYVPETQGVDDISNFVKEKKPIKKHMVSRENHHAEIFEDF